MKLNRHQSSLLKSKLQLNNSFIKLLIGILITMIIWQYNVITANILSSKEGDTISLKKVRNTISKKKMSHPQLIIFFKKINYGNVRNSQNVSKNSNLVNIKNTALQGGEREMLQVFTWSATRIIQLDTGKKFKSETIHFFSYVFLTRAPKYHISITMETGEDTHLILSVSTTTTSLTNLLNTSAGQNCCTVHF